MKISKGSKIWFKTASVLRLKVLDIFILKKFLGTYFMATILILAVISMFDITEKLDAFLTAPLKETLLTISPLSSHTLRICCLPCSYLYQ